MRFHLEVGVYAKKKRKKFSMKLKLLSSKNLLIMRRQKI
ncbi:hypothetical protein NT06LI_0577 [Listeria innocua FSL J1-023]|nr:hypothetical protein NT06LI_0577 [Listeria innocua FSL J1-023]